MEGFVIAVALPAIQQDLRFTQTGLQWIFAAYALVFGGFLLVGGRLADLFGRRRVLVCGFVCFAVGSLVAFAVTERRRERSGAAPLMPLSTLRVRALVIADLAAAARVTRRLGRRGVAVSGFLLRVGGLLWLLAFPTGAFTAASSWVGAGAGDVFLSGAFITGVLPAFVAVGAGAPLAYVPITGAAVDPVGMPSGLASGLFNSAQHVGNAIALALMATAVAIGSALADGSGPGVTASASLTAGLRAGLAVAASLCAMGASAALRLRSSG